MLILYRWEASLAESEEPPKMGVCSLAFSKSGRVMFSSFYNTQDENEESHVVAWDTLRGDPLDELMTGKPSREGSNRVAHLATSPNGEVVFGAGWDANIYMWQG